MPTLKKLKEDKISVTSKLLKKDEDFLPISPEFIKDLKDKILLENSALKLSISDYELMCRKDKVLNMMAIALNKPKAKLKKFCKHITVFKENISKSPKSIANKINGINGPITNLPKEIRSTILDKFAEILPTKYVLLDWIDKDKLDCFFLSENPNAIDLLENNLNEVDWGWLSSNPNAIHILENNLDKVDWELLSDNPSANAINLLKERIKYENLLEDDDLDDNMVDWKYLSTNPNAINLLKKNQDKIVWELLCSNSNAIDLLKKRIEYEKALADEELDESESKIDWDVLSTNPNAIELLTNNQDKIDWEYLSTNPNAIDLLKERIKYEKSLTNEELDELENKINWKWLSRNPNAINLLKANPNKINWIKLSTNPNAIDLLKERIKYEKSLTDAQLEKLENKINWNWLSENPNAIDLLKKNQDKINWYWLSTNPNAIDLLKQRIEYENNLTKTQYNNLKKLDKIDWYYLSSNPNAINLLKGNQDKINWNELSKNPAIFKAV
jgi:hypothetical protein